MEVKAYSSFGQSLLLVGVISAYGSMVDRLHRSELIRRATLFCISNLVIFWFLQPDFFIRNLPATGVAFYLWVGMFGVFVVAQFWAFAADVYTDERGRRLISRPARPLRRRRRRASTRSSSPRSAAAWRPPVTTGFG